MRKILLFVTLFAISFVGKAQRNFDFSAVSENGQILYYKIVDSVNFKVETVCPDFMFWSGYEMPVGDLIIPSVVSFEGQDYVVTKLGRSVFRQCVGLLSVVIPNTVTEIGTSAFYECTGLTAVDVGENVSSVGAYAFFLCEGNK